MCYNRIMAQTIKVSGIVLKSSKHTIEAARLLEIFSPEMGKFSAVIRGVEKPKAKLAVASQPFCFGEFMLAERGGYYTVTDCYVYDSFFNLAYNLDGYVLGCAMLEATSKIVQAGQENLELFKLLLNSLKVIVYENAEPTAVMIKYLMELLNQSGFGFDVLHCDKCGKNVVNEKNYALIYEGSGAVCASHINKDCVDLSAAEMGVFKNIASNEINHISGLKFASREALTSCLKLMLKQFYYRTGEKLISLDKYF